MVCFTFHLWITNVVVNVWECLREAITGITRDHTNENKTKKSIHKLPTKSIFF